MRVIVNKDKLEKDGEILINSGAIGYYEVEVEFDSSWDNLIKKAVIIRKNKEIGQFIAVIDNKIYLDIEQADYYYIGFVGYNEGRNYQISTDLISIYVNKGAGEIETQEQEIPSLTEWEKYITQIQKMCGGVVLKDIKETIDGLNHNFIIEYTNGTTQTFQIIDGKTPIKNVDYWTQKDKESVIEDVLSSEKVHQLEADVQEAIRILENAVQFTNKPTAEKAGVVKVRADYGIRLSTEGAITIDKASNTQIANKLNNFKPIVPSNLNYAVSSVFPVMTQEEYDALKIKDPDLYYCIEEGSL